jgi:hypothetical protein
MLNFTVVGASATFETLLFLTTSAGSRITVDVEAASAFRNVLVIVDMQVAYGKK